MGIYWARCGMGISDILGKVWHGYILGKVWHGNILGKV